MSNSSLNVAGLMEGALEVLRRHPVATGVFVMASALVGAAATWLQAAEINLWLAFLVGFAIASPVASLFIMALGGNLRDIASDPIELVVRLVFGLMAALLVMVLSMIAAFAFLIPGLYVGARWTLAAPLILLKGRGVIQSMRDSWQMTEATAWPLVGTSVILAAPSFAFVIAGLYEPSLFSAELSAQTILQGLIGAGINAFGIAIAIFAYGELTPPSGELSEVFA
jgi:hypothetical protein